MLSDFDYKKFLFIPFKNAGRDFSGCDCWGLVMLVYREIGIELPDFKISCDASNIINSAILAGKYFWRKVAEPEKFSVLTFKISPKYPDFCTHMGVYVGDGKFLHTMRKRNTCIEKLNNPFFLKKMEGAYVYNADIA